jgi:hypothetical protein
MCMSYQEIKVSSYSGVHLCTTGKLSVHPFVMSSAKKLHFCDHCYRGIFCVIFTCLEGQD